jgi:hypothetical protein
LGLATWLLSANIEHNQSLQPLIQNDPAAQKPALVTDVGAALTHVAVSNSTKFGFKGMALIGEFWDSTTNPSDS